MFQCSCAEVSNNGCLRLGGEAPLRDRHGSEDRVESLGAATVMERFLYFDSSS